LIQNVKQKKLSILPKDQFIRKSFTNREKSHYNPIY